MFPVRTPFYVSAMDPGGTTGLSLLQITESTFTVEDQCTVRYRPECKETPIRVLKSWRQKFQEHPHVHVYENFHIRPGRKATDITAYGLIVALEHWVMEDDPYEAVVPQEPVLAKNLITDAILHRLDLRAHGPDARHINDAHRHAATWLASHSYAPLCHAAWPSVNDA